MAHLALYRKYRPSGFEHLLGQEHIKRTLLNTINQDSISHAYLFSGPRGTGKTSTAKLFAKAVSCPQVTNGEPCGKCDTCSDSNPDIIEIDAASNNGVDEIRDLRDKIGYSPVYGKYKVYIIDEVHMLTIGAFNALLKTLEEPPKHAIFILATTEPHKIPLTILSRLQRYDFKRITDKTIVERMKFIIQQENVEVEEAALEIIARVAQGGMRDALSLLDQAIAHADGKVTVEDIIELTGTVDLSIISDVVKAIDSSNTSLVLDLLDQIVESGKEPKFFLDDLLAYYRDILVYRRVGDKANLTKALTDKSFKQVAKLVDEERIYTIIDLLSKCQSQIKYSGQDKVILEVALIKACTESSNNNELLILKKEIETLKSILSKGSFPSISVKKEKDEEDRDDNIQEEKVVDDGDNNIHEQIWAGSEETNIPFEEISKIFAESDNAESPVHKEIDSPENVVLQSREVVQETAASHENIEIDPLNLLSQIELELSNDEKEKAPVENPILEEPKGVIQGKQETSEKSFIEQLRQDIEAGADYIHVIDDTIPALDEHVPPPTIEIGEEEKSKQPELTEKQRSVLAVLNNAKREYRLEYKNNNDEILSTLKLERMSIMTLYREAMVEAISDSHIIVTYKNRPQVKLLEKVMNRSIVQSVLQDVLGRSLELIVLEANEWLEIKEIFTGK
ncbi:DNA polymerase III subunit gamma/tau [Cytobacillus praedii]|uniref:DNA polymerase III subunit gamma/tau n=1 Tax=Cytobacillus praedii TaxID=1742358 RepID=UPI002E1D2F58|nr:DNA polymerase III subunit gamma/tau [Cytobacillus praedii]MED3576121.1 DNA polymerase III subunit gamma/tau [Cytobacillus praedii]